MQPPQAQDRSGDRRNRRSRRRGSEMLEFSMVFLPLMAMFGVTADVAWSVFVKSTLQRAVRVGVRTGVTLTSGQMAGSSCLTPTVKGIVQQNSLGLLNGTAGLAMIKVNYFQPPLPNSTAAATDVSTQANGHLHFLNNGFLCHLWG